MTQLETATYYRAENTAKINKKKATVRSVGRLNSRRLKLRTAQEQGQQAHG